jgi:hypothetical protein
MNCGDVDRLLSEGIGISELQERAGGHIRGCSRCGPLVDFISEPIDPPHDESDSNRKIAASLTTNLSPAKPLASTAQIAVAIAGSSACGYGLWIAIMGIPGFSRLDHMRRFALTVYSFVLLVLLSISLARLLRPAAPRPISPTLLLLSVAIGYPALASLLFPVQPVKDSFVAEGVVCLLFGLITSIFASILIWAVGRRGYPVNRTLSGAITGALGGLTGIIALQWICPDHEGAHIAFWHGLTGLLSIAGGAMAGAIRRADAARS